MERLIIDTDTGFAGSPAEWVAAFARVWQAPGPELEALLRLLSPAVVLMAPTQPPRSTGRNEAREAFQRTLNAMPDLTGMVERWVYADGVLFIEMTFSATLGRRAVRWRNIDRLLFQDGVAVERRAIFDPTPVRRALLSGPSGWRQLKRLRAGTRSGGQ